MSLSKLSERYARSLLRLAVEQKKLEEVYKDMTFLNEICRTNRDFVLMLKSPIIKPDKKFKIIAMIFANQVGEITMGFFAVTVRKRRELYLSHIAKTFVEQYNVLQGIKQVNLTTAVSIDENLKNRIKQMVKDATQVKDIELETVVDKNILAGFVLKFEDKLYDASAASKLDALAEEFNKNTYSKNF